MKFFRNMETFFQTYIEGFFDKRFASGLQPIEISKQIAKKMEAERFVGISHIYVPNCYCVYLSDEDHSRLCPYWRAISQEFSGFIAAKAAEKGYTIQGSPIIDLFLDTELSAGKFRIEAKFSEAPATDAEKTADVELEEGLSATRVFSKVSAQPVARPRMAAILTVIEGIDAGTVVDIGVNRINIGRREGNELPLTDMNTSRLHAYIIFEEGCHFLYDAKSLNGTYVNGHRITRKSLADGDRIKLGNTTILYEVK